MAQGSSERLYRQAEQIIPGGVNSPVRSCRAVGTHPLFIARGLLGGWVRRFSM